MVQDMETRPDCPVVYTFDRFKVHGRTFNQQYDKFYNARYNQMYDWVKEAAVQKWGQDMNLIHLSDLMDRKGETVVVIGALLKVMKLHPSVLSEVSEDLELISEPPPERFTSGTDYFSLQEPGENVALVGGPDVPTHVTGIMVAVKGHEHDNGNKFIVEDFCYPIPCPQKPLVVPKRDMYILFVSDLSLALTTDPKVEAARNYLMDFVTRQCEGKELREASSAIVRVIIAGNCMDEAAADQEKELEVLEAVEEEDEWNKKERSYTIETLALIDEFLASMGKSVPVDVMSGPFDMTSYLMPQQAMHPLMLPKSARTPGVKCTTNPYSATFGEIQVLGSCGRVAQSIREMTTIDEAVDALDQTITWRHMIPTAPDSVAAYPFLDTDPFVMEERPHVYFVGNQKEFNSKLSQDNGKKTKIISVPSFKLTRSAVMLNLRTLEL